MDESKITWIKVGNGHPFVQQLVGHLQEHAQALASTAFSNRWHVAVMVLEPDEETRKFLARTGWNGDTVLGWTDDFHRKLAKHSDPTTRRWMLRKRGDKEIGVFLFMYNGTLLLNFNERGWQVEPGSQDYEWMS
jgi:hypothetical protein